VQVAELAALAGFCFEFLIPSLSTRHNVLVLVIYFKSVYTLECKLHTKVFTLLSSRDPNSVDGRVRLAEIHSVTTATTACNDTHTHTGSQDTTHTHTQDTTHNTAGHSVSDTDTSRCDVIQG
jgi:hypothetical protein